MKRTSFFAGLLMILMLQACGNEDAPQIQEQVATSVQVETVSLSDQQITRTYTGSLEGERQADIYAKIGESVEKVHVREGQKVRQGQILISLDRTGPSSMYRTTESVFLNAEKNFRKMEYLFREGAIAESQFDGAKTDHEVSKASFESAKKLVEVEAPFDGVVTSLVVSAGDYLHVGQKLATIASVDRIRAKFGVNSRDISNISEGDSVTVSASEVSLPVEGQIVSVSRSANPDTRAFQVEVLFENKELLYRPGMFIRVETVLDNLKNVIVIPRDAVVRLDEQDIVFIINDNKAHKRSVILGPDLEGLVVITDGLNAGERIVTLGQTYLDDGFKVKVTGMESSDL